MSYRPMIIASAAVTAGLAAVASAALGRLPAGTRLPIHWNAAGEVDRLADAGTALFMPVVIAAIVTVLMAATPRLEPLQRNLAQSRELFVTSWAAVLFVFVLVETMIAAPAFNYSLPPTLPPVAMGVLLIAIGNVLPKSRPGFFVGIRTPWTLIDADNWIATHRLGARLMVGAGVLVILAALLPLPPAARMVIVAAAIGIVVVVPIGYSWWHWRRATAG